MNKEKFTEKLKDGISVHEVEKFIREHTSEVFTVLALIIGVISSTFDFFTGPGWTIFFLAVGILMAIFFPVPVEKKLKHFYSFLFQQEKATEMVFGGVEVLIAIFVPFIFFWFLGLLAGTAFHYYIRHAKILEENKSIHRPRRAEGGEEHD